ncbi:MAG TPA: dihydrofolate reductase family protein [Thermoleophilaceae bacterium]|jgi:dihydrofolate reductase
MDRLIYSMGVSLDGYVEDARGDFGWSAPPEDVHRIANEEARAAAAFLFGRRMYELMESFWPAAAARGEGSEVELEFAHAYVETPRIVFSDTLEGVGDGARLVRSKDARAEVERLKEEAGGPLSVSGPGLAASLADLIDEFRLWVSPVVVGAGKPFFPEPPGPLRLRLAENRTCSEGVLYLRYERETQPYEREA